MTNISEGKVQIGELLITPKTTDKDTEKVFGNIRGGLKLIDNILFDVNVFYNNNNVVEWVWLEPMLGEDDINRKYPPFGYEVDKKYEILKEWLKDKNYTGNEYEWGEAYIKYINMDGTPRQDCNECKLILRYKQGKETPKLRKEEDGLLEFILYLIQNSGSVYFVTSNGIFGKKTVEMDINLFNEERLGDNVVLVGSNSNNPFKKDSIRQSLDKIKLPKIKYYKVNNIKLLYRVLLYCKTKGVKNIVTISENCGSIDIDKAIYTIEYLAKKFIN